MRAPATKRIVPEMRTTTVPVERSGSSTIIPASGMSTTRNGRSPVLNSRMASPFFAASIAVHTTTANLANSDGCTLTPRSSQRRAPFTSGAMDRVKGKSTTTNSAIATAMSGHPNRRHTW